MTMPIPEGGERESNYLRHERADVPHCWRAAEEDEAAPGSSGERGRTRRAGGYDLWRRQTVI